MDERNEELLEEYLTCIGEDYIGAGNRQLIDAVTTMLLDRASPRARTNTLFWTYDFETQIVEIEHRYRDTPPVAIKLSDLVERLKKLTIPKDNGVTKRT